MITIAFCLVPVEAGIIFYYRPRSSGKNVRRDREYVKKGSGAFEYLCLPLFLFLIAGLLGLVFYPLTNYLESFFSPWIPEWVKPDNVMRGLRACSSNQRNAALMLGLVISGFAAPIVEEIYFRGFLLSKMQSIGKFAPAFNAFLFALYHMYNPWNIPAIFFAFLPIAYTVWYGKDIVVGIIAHIMINLFGVIQVFWLSRG